MSLFVAIDSNCGKNKAKVEDEATRHHSVGSSNFRFFFFFFLREFQLMASTPDDISLSSNQNTYQFLV